MPNSPRTLFGKDAAEWVRRERDDDTRDCHHGGGRAGAADLRLELAQRPEVAARAGARTQRLRPRSRRARPPLTPYPAFLGLPVACSSPSWASSPGVPALLSPPSSDLPAPVSSGDDPPGPSSGI